MVVQLVRKDACWAAGRFPLLVATGNGSGDGLTAPVKLMSLQYRCGVASIERVRSGRGRGKSGEPAVSRQFPRAMQPMLNDAGLLTVSLLMLMWERVT